MKSAFEDSPRRYVDNLPSTPQMARYTAARSAYTDPTVQASPPAWWGSSLGGCGSCGVGAVPEDLKDEAGTAVTIGVTALVTYFAAKSSKSPLTIALVAAGAAFLGGVIVNQAGLYESR